MIWKILLAMVIGGSIGYLLSFLSRVIGNSGG